MGWLSDVFSGVVGGVINPIGTIAGALLGGGGGGGGGGFGGFGLGDIGDFIGGNLGTILPLAGALFGGGDSEAASVSFRQLPETDQAKLARTGLFELATGDLPDIPRRGIARAKPIPFKEGEQEDFWSMPEVQGIIMEAVQKGDLLANRIGRALQATGNMASSPGRDVLGRAVTDVQKSLTASLAPFAEAQRGRAFTERTQERNWRLQQELLAMGFSQDELNALFQQETTEAMLPYTLRAPMLQSIIGAQPGVMPVIQGQQPSTISQIAPLIGELMSSVLNKTQTTQGTVPQGYLSNTLVPAASAWMGG